MPTPPDLHGQKVTIFGMGRSGQAAARLALAAGAAVTCTDRSPNHPPVPGATNIFGHHRPEDLLTADLIVVSPGIPAATPLLQQAAANGVPLIGELGFAARFLPDLPLLAVSGTNGKSTTTHFLGQLLDQAGLRAFRGGNLGTPLSTLALALLTAQPCPDGAGGRLLPEELRAVVIEVSSYQLELPGELSPTGAVILNLTPDHLARHGTMEGYAAAKLGLFRTMRPGAIAVLPPADPFLRFSDPLPPSGVIRAFLPASDNLPATPGVRFTSANGGPSLDIAHLSGTPDDGPIDLRDLPVPGDHNRLNLAAALLLAVHAGAPRSALQPGRLSPLPHRLELIPTSDGRRWINDSKATNVDAAAVGIRAMGPHTLFLLGGQGKEGADYTELAPPLRERASQVICFGADGPTIAAQLREADTLLPLILVGSLAEAVSLARSLTSFPTSSPPLPSDPPTILLSPACASFDEFLNFEDRGTRFATMVQAEPAP